MGIEYGCAYTQSQVDRIPITSMSEHYSKKGFHVTHMSFKYKSFRYDTRPPQEWFDEHQNCERQRDYNDGTSDWEDKSEIEYIEVHLEAKTQREERIKSIRKVREEQTEDD